MRKRILHQSLCIGCRVVIFDLDDTLVDTPANLAQPTHRPEAFRQMIGDGLRTFAIRALPSEKEALYDRVVAVMRRHMDTSASIRAVGVSWGLRTREELIEHKAVVVIDEPAELLNLVG